MSGDKKKKQQDRKFWGVLYPDSTTYDCNSVLQIVESYFEEWAWILHDRDVEEDGTPKKPHIHWMGKSRSPLPLTTISNKLGVEVNYIQFVDKWKKCAQYLVHETNDSEDKYHYLIEDVHCNFDFTRFVRVDGAETQARNIFDAILRQGICDFTSLGLWCLDNGCYGEYIRAMPLWREVLKEQGKCKPRTNEQEEREKEYNETKKRMMELLNKQIEEGKK